MQILTTPPFIQRSGRAAVVVVQAAEHRESDDFARLRSLGLWWHGNCLADTLVRSGMIEEAGVLPDHFRQMALVEDEHVVKTVPVQGSKHALTDGIRIGSLGGGANGFYT